MCKKNIYDSWFMRRIPLKLPYSTLENGGNKPQRKTNNSEKQTIKLKNSFSNHHILVRTDFSGLGSINPSKPVEEIRLLEIQKSLFLSFVLNPACKQIGL